MAATTAELVTYGRFLRNAAPEEFDRFREALERYQTTLLLNLIEADAGSFLHRQGQANQCRALLGVLKECENG